ncbi:MAG: hypothetical protein BWX88_03677 [Planctomycetes bacterium ADurb.Bin126]|nr:MAG: hypothetical protein BWX88_03677 [Planctomycetes bacterium ADurb.Bin126]
MFYRPTKPEDLVTAGQHLAEAPSVGPVKRWLYGVGVAGLVVLVGGYMIFNPESVRLLFVLRLDGRAGGVMAAAAGMVLHCHYFWAPSQRFWPIGHYGKIAWLLVLVLALGYMIWLRAFASLFA